MQILSFDIGNMFMRLCLMIDTIIYKAIGWMYSIFYTIASSRIFSSEVVTQFLSRMYSIIGVVMLFIVAYSLLNVIINPDNLSKGKSTPSKIVFNVVLSLISIIFIPTIFNFGYSLQGAIMQENVLGKLILGSTSVDGIEDVAGGRLAVNIFQSSFYLTENADEDVKAEYDDYSELAVANNDISYFDNFIADDQNYVEDGYIHYNYVFCGVIGIFVLYCLLVFCFDVGLRAVKLMFLEVIAPLPSLLLIVPGQDKVFKAWVKETLRTFLSLFLRVILIFFGIFLINAVDQAFENGTLLNVSGQTSGAVFFAKLFIILGIFMFIKQAPKLMESLFGIKLEGGMFDLKKRISETGALGFVDTVAGMIGGAGASIRGNRIAASQRYRSDLEKGKITKAQYDSKVRREGGLRAGALGAYYGFKGGMKGIGTAYDAGFDTQLYKANGVSDSAVLYNLLRDNFGAQSYYQQTIKEGKIYNDAMVNSAVKQNKIIDQQISTLNGNLNNQFNPYIDANKELESSSKGIADFLDDEAKKPACSIRRNVLIPYFEERVDSNGNKSGTIRYNSVSLNSSEMSEMRENLYSNLVQAGATPTMAQDAFLKATNFKFDDSEKAILTQQGIDIANLMSFKDANTSIRKEIFDENIGSNKKLQNCATSFVKALTNDKAAVDELGNRIQIKNAADQDVDITASMNVDPNGNITFGGVLADKDMLFKAMDAIKNSGYSTQIEGRKSHQLLQAEITVGYDEKGQPIKKSAFEGLQIKEINNKEIEQASKAQKLLQESNAALQSAEDRSKKLREVFKARNRNNGKGK